MFQRTQKDGRSCKHVKRGCAKLVPLHALTHFAAVRTSQDEDCALTGSASDTKLRPFFEQHLWVWNLVIVLLLCQKKKKEKKESLAEEDETKGGGGVILGVCLCL